MDIPFEARFESHFRSIDEERFRETIKKLREENASLKEEIDSLKNKLDEAMLRSIKKLAEIGRVCSDAKERILYSLNKKTVPQDKDEAIIESMRKLVELSRLCFDEKKLCIKYFEDKNIIPRINWEDRL